MSLLPGVLWLALHAGIAPKPPASFDPLLFFHDLERQLECADWNMNTGCPRFQNECFLGQDLVSLACSYWECRSYPHLWEAERFPACSFECYSFAGEYLTALQARINCGFLRHQQAEAQQALEDVAYRKALWYAAWYAIYRFGLAADRRRQLQFLKDELGDAAFYRGELPDPFPRYFMQEIP